MSFSAVVIEHSAQPGGYGELITYTLRYPRFIHSELMTYRMFSRNASSSRAIPVSRMIQSILDDPATFVEWGKNQAGMQARELLSWDAERAARIAWLDARDQAVRYAQELYRIGAHKQIINRLLEPWMHISVVLTAERTALNHMFSQRIHEDAQPEFRALATCMYQALKTSTPRLLDWEEWHLPFISDVSVYPNLLTAIHCSVARCARVSYNNHEGYESSIGEDLILHDRLVGSVPLHASPTEHQARPTMEKSNKGNFHWWEQYRNSLTDQWCPEERDYDVEYHANVQSRGTDAYLSNRDS